jgi:hypothetical protein
LSLTVPRHPTGRRHPDRSGGPEGAARLIRSLLSARPASEAPALLAAATSPPGVRASSVFLRSADPARLLGWHAPADVAALGLLATGRASRSAEGDAKRCATDQLGGLRDGDVVRIVVAVGRDGTTLGELVSGDTVVHHPPEGGRLHDALHRALGLQTAAPPAPAATLTATIWLGRLASSDAPGRLGPSLPQPPVGTWRQALLLHPAAAPLVADTARSPVDGAAGAPGATLPSEEELITAIRLSGRVWDWARLRTGAAEYGQLAELCPAPLAAWMDDGMFSRWVLDQLTPLPVLARRVGSVLPPELCTRARQLLLSCGVDLDRSLEPWATPERDGPRRKDGP